MRTSGFLRMVECKPKVLRIGGVQYAHEKWNELSKVVDVVECTSTNRQDFIRDLQTKYKDTTNIARNFQSISQTGRFDEELVRYFPATVRSVSHNGAGYDQVDVEPLTKRNIQLSNVTSPVEPATADTAIYLILSCLRNFQEGHDFLIQGKWPSAKCGGAKLGREPSGKTIGILGMGGVGRAIRDRLVPFRFDRILYHNRSRLPPELEKDASYVSMDQLIQESDVICLSVPLNAKTRHIINNDTIAKMKTGTVIVNIARGPVIKEKDLLENLKAGKISSFGSDVFEDEPHVPSELVQMPNVVSLPHMGTHSDETMKRMEEFVVENVWSHITTGMVKTIVPEQKNMNFEHPALLKN